MRLDVQAEYRSFMKYFGSLATTMQTLYLATCKHLKGCVGRAQATTGGFDWVEALELVTWPQNELSEVRLYSI